MRSTPSKRGESRETAGTGIPIPQPPVARDHFTDRGDVLGMTETFAGLGTFARTMRAGGKAAGDRPFIDGLTEVQVDGNASLTTGELIDRMAASGPVQARWRHRWGHCGRRWT